MEKGEVGSVPENKPEGSVRDTQTPAKPNPSDDALREALADLARAATWAANQPNPRRAMSGYSWYNVALDAVEAIEPRKLVDEEQVAIMAQAFQPAGSHCVDCGVRIGGTGSDRSMLDPNICWECGEGQFV